ncbi:FAD-binding protein [Acidianus brierleyi]|uniref:FAD-binding protein n=1 Tax=Acidianus brierleyi TaxID=41673 RepID=UPI001FEC4F9D|nr:FAD-binding protein [Acidianus brierleyi]
MIEVANEEELFKEIRNAYIGRKKISIVGSGSHSDKKGEVISTIKMNSFDIKGDIIEAYAGASVLKIREEASSYGYLFPTLYDGTIGGLLGINYVSPLSTFYGTPRDFTLWCRAITPYGGLNWKIFIGSKGLIGAISKAVMKLFPRPYKIVTLEKSYDSVNELLDDYIKLKENKPIATLVEYEKTYKIHFTYSVDPDITGFNKDDGVPFIEESDKNSYIVETPSLSEFIKLVEKTNPIYAYTVINSGFSKVYLADEDILAGFNYYPYNGVKGIYLKLKKLLDYRNIFE